MAQSLRDIATRFTFLTDKAGVESFTRTLKSMKNQVIAFGAAFGAAFGIKTGLNEIDEFNQSLTAVAGTVKQNEGFILELQNQMFDLADGTQEARGKLTDVGETIKILGRDVKLTDLQNLTAQFLKLVPFAQGGREAVGGFLKDVTTGAIKTGKSVEDMGQAFLQAIGSGDFSVLKDLFADTGEAGVRLIDTIQEKFNVGAFGGINDIAKNFSELKAQIALNREELESGAAAVQKRTASLQTVKNIGVQLETVFAKLTDTLLKMFSETGALTQFSAFLDRLEKAPGFVKGIQAELNRLEMPAWMRSVMEATGILPEPEQPEGKGQPAAPQSSKFSPTKDGLTGTIVDYTYPGMLAAAAVKAANPIIEKARASIAEYDAETARLNAAANVNVLVKHEYDRTTTTTTVEQGGQVVKSDKNITMKPREAPKAP